MNKLIYIPLIVLFAVMLVNRAYQTQSANALTSYELNNTYTVNPITGQMEVNGTSTILETQSMDLDLGIDLTTGFLSVIIGCVALGTGIGIKIIDTGISERAQKIIFTSAVVFGLWGIFSVLTYDLIADIPLIGATVWLVLTFILMIGFFQEINKGN